jgi:hypothetical protein
MYGAVAIPDSVGYLRVRNLFEFVRLAQWRLKATIANQSPVTYEDRHERSYCETGVAVTREYLPSNGRARSWIADRIFS